MKIDAAILRFAWDFEPNDRSGYIGCPDDQLYACLFYEYAKDSPYLLKVVSGTDKSNSDHATLHLTRAGKFFSLFPEFPSQHWLQIPLEERAARLKLFTSQVNYRPEPLRPAITDDLLDITTGKVIGAILKDQFVPSDKKLSGVTTIPLVIHWSYSNQEILQVFEQWLQQNRPHKKKPARGKNPFRADVLRADLKALGAMRLMNLMSINEAVIYTRKFLADAGGGTNSLFSAARSWSRARRRAEQILKTFDIGGLPIGGDMQFPDAISYQLGRRSYQNFLYFCTSCN